MSKIGQYIQQQIERGNFTVDERGIYSVELSNRKERASSEEREQVSFLGYGNRRQLSSETKGGKGENNTTSRMETEPKS